MTKRNVIAIQNRLERARIDVQTIWTVIPIIPAIGIAICVQALVSRSVVGFLIALIGTTAASTWLLLIGRTRSKWLDAWEREYEEHFKE